MKYTIDPTTISSAAIQMVFNTIGKVIEKKGGTIQITDLLKILNFSYAVSAKIKAARGPVKVVCTGSSCTASNSGTKVEQDLPGTSALGIIIHPKFSCRFILNKKTKTLVIDNIKGLDANIPGPFNPDVDKITIRLPKYVALEV